MSNANIEIQSLAGLVESNAKSLASWLDQIKALFQDQLQLQVDLGCVSALNNNNANYIYVCVDRASQSVNAAMILSFQPKVRRCIILRLAVATPFQRRRIGTRMLEQAARTAREHDCNELFLAPLNENTHVWYERSGFAPVNNEKKYWSLNLDAATLGISHFY